MRRVLLAMVCGAALAAAQGPPGTSGAGSAVQWVRQHPVAARTLPTGRATAIALQFEVDADKHINSSKPTSEQLIATRLKLEPPTDVSIGAIRYPAGHDFTFTFAPDEKLNVYTGAFQVTASLLASRNAPLGVQRVHGELHYQACNDRACFPPKKLPVSFDVRIVRGPGSIPSNPRQSPHIHH